MAWKDRILDLIFPPRCPFCGALLDSSTGDPCPKCRNSAVWLSGGQAVVPGTQFARCVSAAWYTGKLRESFLLFKFKNHPQYAKAYGKMLAEAIRTYLPGSFDLITWVPVSKDTLKNRGYDQARLLAEEAARCLNRQAISLLKKTKQNKTQSSLEGRTARLKNAANVYSVPDAETVKGKRILVIDDILTTGATLEEAARTLRNAGATQVVAATLCRTPPKA